MLSNIVQQILIYGPHTHHVLMVFLLPNLNSITNPMPFFFLDLIGATWILSRVSIFQGCWVMNQSLCTMSRDSFVSHGFPYMIFFFSWFCQRRQMSQEIRDQWTHGGDEEKAKVAQI